MCMGVAAEGIIKVTCRVNAPLECWGCTNSPRYHVERLHTYRNYPNNMDTGVAEYEKQSIEEYAQCNSEMVGNRISQVSPYGRGQTS